jgi:hypothetical protein
MEEMLFRGEGQYNYRSRMALSQKGRLLVGRFYRAAETGIMPDNLDY